MRCDKCQKQDAQVEFQIQINQELQELHLCAQCYLDLRNSMLSPNNQSIGQLFPFAMPQGFFGNSSGNAFGIHRQSDGATVKVAKPEQSGLLDGLGSNLTSRAQAGKIDPVIGRDEEVARVIEILNRRNKNNPVLIGEPGVGKTAIAEGLALRIVEGKVPSKLMNKQVYVLDVASLVADTGIRGQFEERMKQLVQELQSRTDVMLFIDEIHLLVGAGSAQGSMDAGNILKPALARGDIQVIGATTLKEYRVIEKDAALERRFQPVMIQEPSIEKTIEILHGIQSKYEEYHQVRFSREALSACATLSHRYIQDRYLPDKAIDLLDEAGSKVNLRQENGSPATIRQRLEQVVFAKQQATKAEDYERAAQLRDDELKLREALNHSDAPLPVVGVEDIQRIIEEKTGIPVRKLQQAEQSKMKDLEHRLSEKVIGQPGAVRKITKAIRRNRAGLKAANRPIGSFLFVGPTGVGKTELAKRLAEEVFGRQDAMIRLDMSEYMEKHSVSKLIGSPPGYVGHEEAGQLTEQVRRHPYSLILLDEIEKAHPDVQHIFLQIMEDGRLTDSQGRTVSFKDTLVIMTSNAGVTDKKVTVGFGAASHNESMTSVSNSLTAFFRPEFLNRFESIIEFHHLSREDLVKIVDLLLENVQGELSSQNIRLEVTEEAKRMLAELGYHPAYGARPLRRTIQDFVEDRIADLLLENVAIEKIQVIVEDGSLQVRGDK